MVGPAAEPIGPIEYIVTGEPSEVERKEGSTKPLSLDPTPSHMIINVGEKQVKVDVAMTPDKDQIDLLNKQWKGVGKGEEDTKEGRKPHLLKKYVPMMVKTEGGGVELRYVKITDLLDRLYVPEAGAQWFIGHVQNAQFKTHLQAILSIDGESSLSPEKQAEVVQRFLDSMVDIYETAVPKDGDARRRHLHMLWERQINPVAAESAKPTESSKKNPYPHTTRVDSAAYHELLTAQAKKLPFRYMDERPHLINNFVVANKIMSVWAAKKETLTLEDIEELRSMLTRFLSNPKHGFRNRDLYETPGARLVGVEDLKEEMKSFCEWLNTQMALCKEGKQNPVVVASMAFQRLCSISPFDPSYFSVNKQVAKLVANFILLKFGLPPATIVELPYDINLSGDSSAGNNPTPEDALKHVMKGIVHTCEKMRHPSPFDAETTKILSADLHGEAE